jgi:hypothetical protein
VTTFLEYPEWMLLPFLPRWGLATLLYNRFFTLFVYQFLFAAGANNRLGLFRGTGETFFGGWRRNMLWFPVHKRMMLIIHKSRHDLLVVHRLYMVHNLLTHSRRHVKLSLRWNSGQSVSFHSSTDHKTNSVTVSREYSVNRPR